ncbi:AMP-binding protein [Streptomyces sp. NPDC021622]|uniref:AMP-binding protein n=1 Tax=Streptomyces sp. NPDC021622 TaxID=3155013 RepID=UPI0033E77F18
MGNTDTRIRTHIGLWDSLIHGSTHGALYHWDGDRYARTTWREVVADAHGMAATLRAAGVGPGTRVATVLTNSADCVRGLLAVWLAGGAVASLPLPSRGQTLEEYGSLLESLTARLDPTLVLVDAQLEPLVPEGLRADLPVLSWSALHGPGRIEPSPPGLDDVAYIQYSSGSTGGAKGCTLTPRAIAAQLGLILDMTGGRPGAEVIASWMPLSHDMGVFGLMLYSWAFDYDFVMSTPERFGMAPRSWFRDMSEFGATMTGGTTTALYLASRAQGRSALARELALRVCVVGAERVDAEVLAGVSDTFAASGLTPSAFMPAYGMAEATLAVSATGWADAPRVRGFDASALIEGKIVDLAEDDPGAVRLVSNGAPLPGVGVTMEHPDEVSQLLVTSPSLATGYHADPERTAERFRDGVLRTGDHGFVRDGEVYFVGRADDLVSVGGRNVYTSEIEAAVEALGPVRKGCSALVDVAGAGAGGGAGMSGGSPSELVLLLEPARKSDDFQLIADRAAELAREKSGIALSECVFVERGCLPRTPSGKIQRFRCRSMLTRDTSSLKIISRVRLG